MNGPVIFLAKDTNVHSRIRDNSLVTRYIFPGEYCVIPNKAAYMYDETWEKVVKVVAPGIRKFKVSNAACVLTILFSIYLTIHLCPSKISTDDL